MNQSSVIFFFLFAAYFVFITVRGELPIYMGLLLASPKDGGAAPVSAGTQFGGLDKNFAAGANVNLSGDHSAEYKNYASWIAKIAAIF